MALALACVTLRFLWLEDFEYKADQVYSFEATQQTTMTERYPGLGMPSSVGLRNPGASVWIFSALSDLSRVTSPLGLTGVVAVWALLGCLAFAFLIRRYVPRGQQAIWWWGLAAFCVAPHVVRYQRVIWAQSVLLPLGAAAFFFFFKRGHFWGAFGLGFVGLLIGQIHMPGFILLAAGVAFLFWRSRRQVNGFGLVAGTALSTLLMWPWFEHVLEFRLPAGRGGTYWENFFSFKYWLLWFSEPFTDGFRALLGPIDAKRFFAESWWLQVPLGILGLAAAVVTLRDWALRKSGDYAPYAFALWGYGMLLMVLGTSIYRHYLEVAYPLPYVTAAAAISKFPPKLRRLAYPVWVVALAVLSFQLLWFLHRNGGAAQGDYGVSFSRLHR